MAKVERIREVVTGSVDLEYVRQKTEAGWKLVAMEWRREIAGDEAEQPIIVEDIPYGLRVAPDCSRLEEDPQERAVLVQMMELIVQDYSITLVASELNKRGLRIRTGGLWTPVSVFNMLPRLIEVGPHIFSSDDWEARRERLLNMVQERLRSSHQHVVQHLERNFAVDSVTQATERVKAQAKGKASKSLREAYLWLR